MYRIRRTKETATGKRFLVESSRGKTIICSSVSDDRRCISNPECEGQQSYVVKKWEKLSGKQNFVWE
jgi:hypothetical protein